MNQLTINQDQTVTSLQIAEWIGKRHDNVLRDIRNEIEELGEIGKLIFEESQYQSTTGSVSREYTCYKMTQDGVMQLAAKYSAEVRFKIIQKLKELEKSNMPKSFPEALRLAADLAEKNELLKLEAAQKDQIIGELQPKASYYDLILQTKTAIPITKIAKDYGMSGQKMNDILHELGIQYNQSGTWLLYQKYASCGYTASKTHNFVHNSGEQGSSIRTCWTQKGRLFIYDLLKNKMDIVPVIERLED